MRPFGRDGDWGPQRGAARAALASGGVRGCCARSTALTADRAIEYTAAAGRNRWSGGQAVVRILLRLVITALAVWLAATLFPSHVIVQSVEAALLFSIVLGLLKSVVRPVLLLLTLPFTLLTLGLFIIVVNAVVFWLATQLPVGVGVSGFLGALVGALTVSVVSFIANRFLP